MLIKVFLLPFYLMYWIMILPIKFFVWMFKISFKVFSICCFGIFLLLLVLFI